MTAQLHDGTFARWTDGRTSGAADGDVCNVEFCSPCSSDIRAAHASQDAETPSSWTRLAGSALRSLCAASYAAPCRPTTTRRSPSSPLPSRPDQRRLSQRIRQLLVVRHCGSKCRAREWNSAGSDAGHADHEPEHPGHGPGPTVNQSVGAVIQGKRWDDRTERRPTGNGRRRYFRS